MKIQSTKMQVIRFSAEDVIATSLGALTGQSGLFYVDDGNGGYNSFNGTFGSYSGNSYEIVGMNTYETGVGDDRENLITGKNGVYIPELGITLPANPTVSGIAKNAYDAFSSDNGYYTNGISYFELYWQ